MPPESLASYKGKPVILTHEAWLDRQQTMCSRNRSEPFSAKARRTAITSVRRSSSTMRATLDYGLRELLAGLQPQIWRKSPE